MVLSTTTIITWYRTKWPWMTCLSYKSYIRIMWNNTPWNSPWYVHSLLRNIFSIHPGGQGKGCKMFTFSPQYIEQKISIFNEIINQMKEQKTIIHSLWKVECSYKNSLNTTFSPIFSLLGAYLGLINVKYVKNTILENYFEQF